MKQLTILTNDPSLTAWGCAILRNGNVIDTDCIKTVPEHKKRRIRAGDDLVRRIAEINAFLLNIIEQHNVNFMLAELPHGSQNANAAKMIGVVTGIIQTISDVKHIPMEWYSEADAKKALSGQRSISKQHTIDLIMQHYSDVIWHDTKYKDEAIADAMAIYHVATKQSNTLKLLND